MYFTKDIMTGEHLKGVGSITNTVNELYDKLVLIAGEQGVSLTTMGILLKTVGALMLMDDKYGMGEFR